MRAAFLILSLLFIPAQSGYRVRKFIQRPVVRSVADDDLDMAAAELVFKERNTLKPMSDKIEGPPQKLPFGTEHSSDKDDDSIGAPSSEPTASDLRKTNLEDLDDDRDETPLKSSMVGEGSIPEEKPIAATPRIPYKTVSPEEDTEPVLSWQKPLESYGRFIAYDFDVNPEYPQFAPRTRGLVGIPDGWNSDKKVDEEFKSGFRHVRFRRRFSRH